MSQTHQRDAACALRGETDINGYANALRASVVCVVTAGRIQDACLAMPAHRDGDQCAVSEYTFSPARIGTFSQFSIGGKGHEYASEYAQYGLYA